MSEDRNINLVLKHAEDDEKPILTLLGLAKQIKRFFVLWLVLAIVLGVAAGGVSLLMKSSDASVQSVIEFSFDGVEKGKDPNGNEFDVTKIYSPVVLEAALASLHLGEEEIPIDNLRNNIKVKGIVPEDAYQELTAYKPLIESGGSSALSAVKTMLGVSYHPTRYIVALDLEAAGIDEEQGVAVMDAILDSYKRYFYETYGYNKALGSAVLAVDYQEYDYERVVEVFDDTLESAQKYVNTLANRDSTSFRSVATGYSFSDLVAALTTLRTEDLDWLSSYITVNNVTKDKETLLTYYEYRIQGLQRQQTAAESNLASIEQSIAAYQKDTVLVISGDNSNTSTTQTSKQYDTMINKKLAVQEEISECVKNISYYQQRVTSLRETTGVASKAQMKVLDEKLDQLYNRISQLLDTINKTADEYYENVAYVNACSVIVPASVNVSNRGTSMVMAVVVVEALLFVFFAMMIVFWAFVEQYRINKGVVKTVAVAADASEKDEAAASDEESAESKPVQKKSRK